MTCLAFLLVGAPSAEAAKHKKSWPSKKSGKSHHKKSAPAKSGAKPAPVDTSDDDEGEDEGDSESAQGESEEKTAPPFKAKKVAKSSDEDEDEDSSSGSSSDDSDDEGGSTVIRRKPKKVAIEGGDGAPVAIELMAGPRLVNRSFKFNEALADADPGADAAEYKLPRGAAIYLDGAIYPLAYAFRNGVLPNIGIVGRFERLVGTSTVTKDPAGNTVSTTTTTAQQFEAGLRGRIPLGDHEVGLVGTYGQQVFWPASKDPGPSQMTIPNVHYTFIGLGADARLRFGPVTIGAHAGTRIVTDTGTLGRTWFKRTTANAVDAGLSLAVRVAPMFDVVVGGDIVRYGFAFNARPADPRPADNFVAGGAVDQYLSGYLALRVSLTGG
jgi:hypothetical protein